MMRAEWSRLVLDRGREGEEKEGERGVGRREGSRRIGLREGVRRERGGERGGEKKEGLRVMNLHSST